MGRFPSFFAVYIPFQILQRGCHLSVKFPDFQNSYLRKLALEAMLRKLTGGSGVWMAGMGNGPMMLTQRCKEIKRMQRESWEAISNGEHLENKLLLILISINFSPKNPATVAFKKMGACFPMFSRQLCLPYEICVSLIVRNLEVTFALVSREGQDSRVRFGRPKYVSGDEILRWMMKFHF